MDDEFKVGDTVERPGIPEELMVIATFGREGRWLWVAPEGCLPFTVHRGDVRKVKTPTPCPELWANVYPHIGAPPCSTRAEALISAGADRIGVIHLSPNGDCEFIRTEEL